jgi:hypothetical protein
LLPKEKKKDSAAIVHRNPDSIKLTLSVSKAKAKDSIASFGIKNRVVTNKMLPIRKADSFAIGLSRQ